MKTRPLVAIALAALLAGLGWGLWALHHLFAAERAEAVATVDARRRALDRFAAQAFAARLARRLADARPALAVAEADPLAPLAGLYRRRGDRVTVPPPPTTTGEVGACALLATLRDPAARPVASGPWGERLALRAALFDAVAAGGAATIEETTRALFAHRARHRLEPARELPVTLAALAHLAAAAPVDPALLRAVLHDGVGPVEGLQRALLRDRATFAPADFDCLADEVERLSRLGEAPREAFAARRTPPAPPSIPADVPAPALVAGWYVEPRVVDGVALVDGVRVDAAAEAAAVDAAMRDGALLDDDEAVALDADAPVPVAVRSPRWTEAPAQARATWRLKLALIWLCALLALAVAAFAALETRRRRRFVELKSDFIAAVSHELRTPLAAIRLMAETLERRVADVPRARDYPARIVREADALGFLVENLLSFNRIDKGRWVARTQRIGLADLVTRVRDGVEAAFEVAVEWQVTGVERSLDADPALIELLLHNLVRNAIQHHGGERVRLTIDATTAPDGGTRLCIGDDGPGIAPEAAAHVFEPFYRGPAPKSRGSGLGLALCHRIMALHRGALRIAATGPTGTTFEARFPPEEPRGETHP